MLRRASAGRALWALDSDGAARTGLGRPVLRTLGISGSVLWKIAAGDPDVHRAAGGNCAHAARALSPLYISGIVAVVPGSGLSGDEAGRELARAGEIFSQVRCRDWSRAGGRRSVFCVESLAEPDQFADLSSRRSITFPSPAQEWSPGLASCDPTI